MKLQIDEATLDVLDEGSGDPAVLLLHPFPLSKEVWDVPAPALAARSRVIRLDLRGCGASSAPPGPYLMETLAGDVAGVLDALGIERAIVAGNSLGVMVALSFYRMFAERVLALGLFCGRVGADDVHGVRSRNELAAAVERDGTQALVGRYLDTLFTPQSLREHPDLRMRALTLIERNDPHGAAAVLRGMAMRVDSADLLDEIDVPVCVVAGASDRFVPVSELRAVAGAIRGARFEVLDCGHVPELEAPLALTAILEQLVEQVGRRGYRGGILSPDDSGY